MSGLCRRSAYRKEHTCKGRGAAGGGNLEAAGKCMTAAQPAPQFWRVISDAREHMDKQRGRGLL